MQIIKAMFHGDAINIYDKGGKPFVSLSEIASNAHIRWQAETRAAMFTFKPFIVFANEDDPNVLTALISLSKLTSWLHAVRPAAVLKENKVRFNLYREECSSVLSKHWIEHLGRKS